MTIPCRSGIRCGKALRWFRRLRLRSWCSGLCETDGEVAAFYTRKARSRSSGLLPAWLSKCGKREVFRMTPEIPAAVAWNLFLWSGGAANSASGHCQDRSQVTGKLLPLLFSAPGSALIRLELFTMVISSSVKEEITPEVLPSVTLAPEAVHDPKSASG